LDFDSKNIWLLDPLADRGTFGQERSTFLSNIKKELSLQYGENSFQDWSSALYPHQYYAGLSDTSNIGVAIITMIYFVIMDSPIFFTPELLHLARENFCFWLMHGALSM
jgi:hypothetical protein